MVFFAQLLGSVVAIATVSALIHRHRKKSGTDNPIGAVIWSVWVALAIYPMGTMLDYNFSAAGAYLVSGLIVGAVAFFAKKGRAAAKLPE